MSTTNHDAYFFSGCFGAKGSLKWMILSAFLLSACSGESNRTAQNTSQQTSAEQKISEDTGSSVSKLLEAQQEYLVAVDPSHIPYAFRDENAQVIGFDVDLLNAIGEHQGFKVRFLSRPWAGIFQTLDTGERDIVASCVTMKPEREEIMDFSVPYLKKARAALVADKNIQQLEDLKGKKVAVQFGTTEHELVEKMFNDEKNVVSTKTTYLSIKDVASGSVAAAFSDAAEIAYYANSDLSTPVHMIVVPSEQVEYVGFAVKKGRKDLKEMLDEGLKHLKADGTYDTLYEKWFGKTTDLDLRVE